jgi:molybdopterin-guanine dinucleotide biosynthesis protein B
VAHRTRDLHIVHTPGAPIEVIGFVGASGSGKTTLITALVPLLSRRGLRVAVLKHARHGFDMDRPGKDSYRAREAGAAQVLIASRERWVLMGEAQPGLVEPPFAELLDRFDPREIDLVLAEGFAGEPYRKIEVYRPSLGEPPKCWPHDPHVCAVATDALVPVAAPVVRLDLNRPGLVADYLLTHVPLARRAAEAIHAD